MSWEPDFLPVTAAQGGQAGGREVMMKGLLYLGLALLALWVVLTVTRVIVGGVLWLVLAAGVVALVAYGVQAASGRRRVGS